MDGDTASYVALPGDWALARTLITTTGMVTSAFGAWTLSVTLDIRSAGVLLLGIVAVAVAHAGVVGAVALTVAGAAALQVATIVPRTAFDGRDDLMTSPIAYGAVGVSYVLLDLVLVRLHEAEQNVRNSSAESVPIVRACRHQKILGGKVGQTGRPVRSGAAAAGVPLLHTMAPLHG